jgi:hypothetical protein
MTELKNDNVLKGFRCPECGYEDSFKIDGHAEFMVTDDGTDETSGVEWDDHAHCSCGSCNHDGQVFAFQLENQTADMDLIPDDGTEPNLATVAEMLYYELLEREMTSDDPKGQDAAIGELMSAMKYAAFEPYAMALYLEKLNDWACDAEYLEVFKLIPSFKYMVKRVQRVKPKGT